MILSLTLLQLLQQQLLLLLLLLLLYVVKLTVERVRGDELIANEDPQSESTPVAVATDPQNV